jgi:hypothetical protein
VGKSAIVSFDNAGYWRSRWQMLTGKGFGQPVTSGEPRERAITLPQFEQFVKGAGATVEHRRLDHGQQRLEGNGRGHHGSQRPFEHERWPHLRNHCHGSDGAWVIGWNRVDGTGDYRRCGDFALNPSIRMQRRRARPGNAPAGARTLRVRSALLPHFTAARWALLSAQPVLCRWTEAGSAGCLQAVPERARSSRSYARWRRWG